MKNLLLLVSVILLLAACDGNYLVWSSDGSMAAAVGAKGLRLVDSEGNISKVLYEQAGMFRWIPHEHQGLVVGYEYASSWSELKGLLSREQVKKVSEESAALKRKIQNYRGDKKKFAEQTMRSFRYPLEAILHLRANSSPDFEKLALQKWPAFTAVKVPVYFIKLLQLDDKSARLLRVVNKGIDEIVELRISPNAKYLACVKHENRQQRNYIEALPLVAFAKSTIVADNTNAYPDWGPDSRSLYFSRPSTSSQASFSKDTSNKEGSLCKIELIDQQGKLSSNPKEQKLSSLFFENKTPVRVMKDGRVFFISRELRIPQSTSAPKTNAVFAWQEGIVESVFRKNTDIAYFEPSPEGDQLAVTTASGALYLANLANPSESSELVNNKGLRVSGLLPQWKTNGELSFGLEQQGAQGSKPSYSVKLWTKGQTKDLSKSWGKEALSEILVRRDMFQEAVGGVVSDIDKKESGK